MIGKSKALVDIQNMIDKVAPTMARVFIQGPNGSGKELVARLFIVGVIGLMVPLLK